MSAKPPKTHRKIEDLRVTRKTNVHAHTGGGEGWAVSYADMLMVLLSFFVMFFSLKDENPQTFDDQLKKISLSMKGLSDQSGSGQKVEGHGPASVAPPVAVNATTLKGFPDLAAALKMDGVTVVDENGQIVLTLDDDAFKSASFEPTHAILGKMDQVVARLGPYRTQVQLTIVGHTDARKLAWRNKYLQDNFDLSSLRALRVLKHITTHGFPENHATARAASSFDRVARSVSLVIQPLDASASEVK